MYAAATIRRRRKIGLFTKPSTVPGFGAGSPGARDRFDNRPLFLYFHLFVLPKPFHGQAVPGRDIVR
jgi:hypothetical protein